jgi:hypothetical protein
MAWYRDSFTFTFYMVTACLTCSSALKMKALCSSETPMNFHLATRCYVTENSILHSHYCKNHGYRKLILSSLPVELFSKHVQWFKLFRSKWVGSESEVLFADRHLCLQRNVHGIILTAKQRMWRCLFWSVTLLIFCLSLSTYCYILREKLPFTFSRENHTPF